MRTKKLGRVILSFALAAALVAEPAAAMPVVHAQETQPMEMTEPGSGDMGKTEAVSDNSSGEAGEKPSEGGNPDEGENPGEGGNPDEGENPGEGGNPGEGENPGEGGNPDEGKNPAEGEDPGEGDDPAEGENPEEEAEGETETVSDNSTEETEEDDEKKEESDDTLEMPDGYQLTSYQKELKSELGNILYQFSESDEGVTYAESQVYTHAESREEAEMIAAAYHAEIIDFDMGVLTLRLGGDMSVKSALTEAADMANNLPPVWPSYRRELFGEVTPEAAENDIPGLEVVEEEYELEGQAQQEVGDVPSLEAYEQALNELTAYNDPFLQPNSESYQWFHTTIGSVYAWDAGYKGANIKVGVIDSGVDSNADLNGNVFGSRNFINESGATTDDDGSGHKHGTHVAGIIAALQNDSQGVGVAPSAKIFNAKVFGAGEASGYDPTIEKAILYLINDVAAGNEPDYTKAPLVDVINMSLGGPGYNPSMEKVLAKAKKKGVVVLAASGNDGGQLSQYPASYNNVISVAATDINNQRASFSNYGSAVDVSAPGVDIWSTYGSSYASLQGTSMACPVAAGEAAVILSGANDLAAMKDNRGALKTGAARVSAVESIMKGKAIGVGGGMGKGITSLPKVFGLTVAAAKPNAPTFSKVDTSSDKLQSYDITIKAQSGMKICYTTNGKNPVWKDGVAGAGTTLVNDDTKTIPINGETNKKAKGTIKAIAVNAAGVVSNVKAFNYELKPYVGTITIAGPKRVEQGKTIKLSATVEPAYATKKAVTWKITTETGADTGESVKIDGNGKITTKVTAVAGKYKVTATATDRTVDAAVGEYEIAVVLKDTAIQSLAMPNTKEKPLTRELWLNSTKSAAQVNLFDYVVAKEKNTDEATKRKTPLIDIAKNDALKARLKWTSSKPAVATVDVSGKVTAKAPGKTKITVKADDNLGKAASVEITVKQAVTRITIQSSTDKFTVARGKSIVLKATVTPEKPANKKVTWSVAAPAGVEDAAKDKVNINKNNGKLTVPANATPGDYTVTATAADQQGVTATQTITVFNGGAIGGIAFASKQNKITLYTKAAEDKANTATITATITGVKDKKGNVGTFDPTAYKVTNSNPAVVTAEEIASNTAGVVTIKLTTTGQKKGKANIVVAATDGSGKKATCAVTVNGAISKVAIVDDLTAKKPNQMKSLTLFRAGLTSVSGAYITDPQDASKVKLSYTNVTPPSTATLYAKIDAPNDNTANSQAWTAQSNNPKLVQVTSINKETGAITLQAGEASTGQAVITLSTTDGSNKKATCTVKVVNPASRINIAPKNGAGYCVAWGKTLQLSAVQETNHGAVANKAVTWSVEGGYENILTVDKNNGKVKVKAVNGDKGPVGAFTITATAKDGSGVKAAYRVLVLPPTTRVKLDWDKRYIGVLGRGKRADIYFTADCHANMICTSSNPSVASPTISYDPSTGVGYFTLTGNKKGTTKITVKALDGTGKTDSMTIQVK